MPSTKEGLDFSEDRAVLWVPGPASKPDPADSRFSRLPSRESQNKGKRNSESASSGEIPSRSRAGRRNSDPGTSQINLEQLGDLYISGDQSESESSTTKDMVTKEGTELSMTRPQIMKTNTFTLGDISEDDNVIKRRQSIEGEELDYKSEVDVGDYTAREIKVIVGRNRVRVIGERAFGSLEGSNGFHKVVQVPSNVDPLSLKSNLRDGKVVLTGKFSNKNRKWTINKRGLMTVKDDGCARITIDLPKGINPSQVRVKTVTKHYLVVSNAEVLKSPRRSASDDIAEDFIETFELPSDCDLGSLCKRTMGESAVVVEFGSQTSNGEKPRSSGGGHRPRSFTF